MEALIPVATRGGPTMLARMLRTLSRHLPTAHKARCGRRPKGI